MTEALCRLEVPTWALALDQAQVPVLVLDQDRARAQPGQVKALDHQAVAPPHHPAMEMPVVARPEVEVEQEAAAATTIVEAT